MTHWKKTVLPYCLFHIAFLKTLEMNHPNTSLDKWLEWAVILFEFGVGLFSPMCFTEPHHQLTDIPTLLDNADITGWPLVVSLREIAKRMVYEAHGCMHMALIAIRVHCSSRMFSPIRRAWKRKNHSAVPNGLRDLQTVLMSRELVYLAKGLRSGLLSRSPILVLAIG